MSNVTKLVTALSHIDDETGNLADRLLTLTDGAGDNVSAAYVIEHAPEAFRHSGRVTSRTDLASILARLTAGDDPQIVLGPFTLDELRNLCAHPNLQGLDADAAVAYLTSLGDDQITSALLRNELLDNDTCARALTDLVARWEQLDEIARDNITGAAFNCDSVLAGCLLGDPTLPGALYGPLIHAEPSLGSDLWRFVRNLVDLYDNHPQRFANNVRTWLEDYSWVPSICDVTLHILATYDDGRLPDDVRSRISDVTRRAGKTTATIDQLRNALGDDSEQIAGALLGPLPDDADWDDALDTVVAANPHLTDDQGVALVPLFDLDALGLLLTETTRTDVLDAVVRRACGLTDQKRDTGFSEMLARALANDHDLPAVAARALPDDSPWTTTAARIAHTVLRSPVCGVEAVRHIPWMELCDGSLSVSAREAVAELLVALTETEMAAFATLAGDRPGGRLGELLDVAVAVVS